MARQIRDSHLRPSVNPKCDSKCECRDKVRQPGAASRAGPVARSQGITQATKNLPPPLLPQLVCRRLGVERVMGSTTRYASLGGQMRIACGNLRYVGRCQTTGGNCSTYESRPVNAAKPASDGGRHIVNPALQRRHRVPPRLRPFARQQRTAKHHSHPFDARCVSAGWLPSPRARDGSPARHTARGMPSRPSRPLRPRALRRL